MKSCSRSAATRVAAFVREPEARASGTRAATSVAALLDGGFTRRRFLQIGGGALVASWFDDVVEASVIESATSASPSLHGTAKNCILVFLDGGASQVDTFDLKEGPWTPPWFAPATYGDLRLPQGLLPRLSEHASRLAIIRSGLAWAAVHQVALVWAQSAAIPSAPSARSRRTSAPSCLSSRRSGASRAMFCRASSLSRIRRRD